MKCSHCGQWKKSAEHLARDIARIEHNAEVAIKRAIKEYMKEAGIGD